MKKQEHGKTTSGFAHRFVDFLGSRKFFGIVIGLLVVQAAWVALTARYPQAFDEQFHFGLIKLHAQHLSPYLSQEYDTNGVYGAISRDPSYLYHYFMSFPYRLVALFTHDLTIQVVALRFINIGFMAIALFVLRRVLRYTKASMAVIQTCLFFFVITPVVPLLASQVNYDNLLILLIGLAVWWALRFVTYLREQTQWRWDILLELGIICLIASLVKYTFLPILAAIVVVMGPSAWRYRYIAVRPKVPLRLISKLRLALYILVIVVGTGLFVERYGVNLVRYHTPTPQCDQVLPIDECQEYPPWARDYYNLQHKMPLSNTQKVTYPLAWVKHTISEVVFAIGSGYNKDGVIDYYVGTQLPIPDALGWLFLVIAIILMIYYRRWYWQNYATRLFAIMSILYVLALLLHNWRDYIAIGQLVAIHGRYLVILLPFLYVTIALGLGHLYEQLNGRTQKVLKLKVATVLVVALLMTQGGGIITYIVRSDFWWFWPQSSAAQQLNGGSKRIFRPLVIGV